MRLKFYKLRKNYMLSKLVREMQLIDNKMKFILAVINDQIQIKNKKKADVVKQI